LESACLRRAEGLPRGLQMASQSNAQTMHSNTRREPIAYRRIVVKAGTTLLTGGGDRLNLQVMATLVEQLALLRLSGVETILVSSGAVAAGRHVLGITRDGDPGHFRQVLAAAGQGRLMHAYEQLFDWHEIPVAQALLSRKDISERLGYLNIRNTLLTLMELRVVPIVNENDVVAVDELKGDVFGDNDTLSAMVANLVDADFLVMLGQVGGLFTADPNIYSEAELIETVETLDDEVAAMGGESWDGRGQGGMATKLDAARLATASGVDVAIASGLEADVLTRLAGGEHIGTFFPSTADKMESRKRWMLSGLTNHGDIVVDAGASDVIRSQSSSLLPAGVHEVRGAFQRGDIVSILGSDGNRIAAGITNYDSTELDMIKGSHSSRIEEVLGHAYGDEVVHRNNMVSL
jgi:glutamate 5-kinase